MPRTRSPWPRWRTPTSAPRSGFNAHFGPKVGVPAYLAAAAIGLARVDKNVHNLSDVLAGATLGYVVGRTVVKHDGTPQRKAHFQIVPSAPASGAGVGAGFSVDW